jgi:hypothetical protein
MVPFVWLRRRALFMVSASCSTHVPPTPLNVIGQFIDVPLVAMVRDVVEVNVVVPVLLHTVPVDRDILPATLSVGVVPSANVTVPAETVKLRQASAPVMVTVKVPPELLSKITLSAAVGTAATVLPPLVVRQFVVRVVFQVPVPPTQYLSAMATPLGQLACL